MTDWMNEEGHMGKVKTERWKNICIGCDLLGLGLCHSVPGPNITYSTLILSGPKSLVMSY